MKNETGRAAEYLRMSTDLQEYSTENQADAIRIYAALRGLEIVATYKDEGKSGLSAEGRDGLQALIGDVERGDASFDVIVVYDVSRWGRFQDPDEAAYYEHICKRAGKRVEYCAEPFQNDGSPLSAILKGLKRAMAGEYSRELSVKVWQGQRRIVEKGFRHGASAGYGLRRQAIDRAGTKKLDLAFGEHKNLKTDRVILVPGPTEEVEMVQWIYERFVAGATEQSIVDDLNVRGIKTDLGRPFTKQVVRSVLTSEKYIGTHVWNRTSTKLRAGYRRNDPDSWIRVPGAFEAIVAAEVFEAAQAERRARSGRLSDDELLGPLRKLLEKNGQLTHSIIENAGRYPTVSACVRRFGSIRETYKRVGYVNPKDHRYVEINQRVRNMRPLIALQVMQALFAAGMDIHQEAADYFNVGGKVLCSVVISRFRTAKDVTRGWHVIVDGRQPTDLFLVARLDEQNQKVIDYYALSLTLLSELHFNLTERKAAAIGGDYRAGSLDGVPAALSRMLDEMDRGVSYRVSGRGTSLRFRRGGCLLA